MEIYLQEYIGAIVKTSDTSPFDEFSLKESQGVSIADNSLMAEIEGVHSVITGNDTYYTPECLKESVPHWTAPYEKPLIMHHKEEDGKIVGRVKAVNYIEHSELSKTPALEFIVNVGDEEGIKGVKNGTLLTVSIGARVTDVECSICGTNFNKFGFCEHKKGMTYDGKRCYWKVNAMRPKEISYVIVPSDMYACTTRVYDLKNNLNTEVKESMSNMFKELMEKHGITPSNITLTEGEADPKTEGENPTTEPEKKEEPESKEVEEESKTEEEEPESEEVEEESKTEDESKTEEEESESKEVEEESKTEEHKEKEESEEDLKAELEKLKIKLEVLEKDNKEKDEEIAKALEALKIEKELAVKASSELKEYRAKEKLELVEQIISYRKELNLTESKKEDLLELTDSVLKAQKESLSEVVNIKGIKSPITEIPLIESNVSVSDEKDNTIAEKTEISVKESKTIGNIDLQETLVKILNRSF